MTGPAAAGQVLPAVPSPPIPPSIPTLADPDRLPAALAHPVLAIGNFDGVHRGHAALIAAARRLGEGLGRPAAVLTFDPHPRAFFQPGSALFRLTPPDLKAEAAGALGAAAVVALPFDAALAALDADAFIDRIILQRLGASGVVTGADFRFGKGRRGDAALLAERAAACGFAFEAVPPVTADGAPVSSTRIRALLAEGDAAAAARLIGRPFRVRGEVAHGDKRGRLLGYPTANLVLDPATGLRHGIYAVRASVDGASHPAVASFGRRPTFDDGAPRLEAHLFDFAGDLYGRTMDVDFVGWIRPELKFDGVEPLIRQMDADSLAARAMLSA